MAGMHGRSISQWALRQDIIAHRGAIWHLANDSGSWPSTGMIKLHLDAFCGAKLHDGIPGGMARQLQSICQETNLSLPQSYEISLEP